MARLTRNLSFMFVSAIAYISLLTLLISNEFSKYQRVTLLETAIDEAQAEDIKLNPGKYTMEGRKNSLKYIFLWWYGLTPLHHYHEGQEAFIMNNCEHSNCYFTYNISLLKDLTDFDAIVFNGCNLGHITMPPYHGHRSSKQKYVFAMIEPASRYPVVHPLFDGYFNWTWTFRLESDLTWKYITIYDLNGYTIGPAVDMKWPKTFKPIDQELKIKLKHKTKAVAWFVSHCSTPSRREQFVEEFKVESQKFGFSVDVYGTCGPLKCDKSEWCLKMLEKNYHFYFSFENALDEDYVTEKLIIALDNLVVPVVYGGSNYSRFLPPGSYLNARELGPRKLAIVINDAIRNLTLYYDYFRWRNHFKYEWSEKTSELCNICTALNDDEKMKTSIITNFRAWWNTPTRHKTYEYVLKEIMANKDLRKLAANYNFTRAGSRFLWENILNRSSFPSEFFDQSFSESEDLNVHVPTYNYNFSTTTDPNEAFEQFETTMDPE